MTFAETFIQLIRELENIQTIIASGRANMARKLLEALIKDLKEK